jgi:CheY-like chemotaxis protein
VVNIYLPAEPVSQAVEGGDDFKADGVPTKKWILVMEDEKMLRNLVRHMLERLGYEGITVKDGTEAIEAYRKYLGSDQPFDAVLLDLTIKGGMGGEETIRRLRKLDPNVKAIVCSGYFDDAFITDFESYGFKEAMAKPYEMKTLKETLEKLIG